MRINEMEMQLIFNDDKEKTSGFLAISNLRLKKLKNLPFLDQENGLKIIQARIS